MPTLATTTISGSPGMPVLLVGPSLGTSVEVLWHSAATHLTGLHVIGWDLPGHGRSPAPDSSYTMSELARAIGQFIDTLDTDVAVHYAGVSVAGAVGLQLLLDRPAALRTATLLCTGAKIGDPDDWRTRAARVAVEGTSILLTNARARWFSRNFAAREPGHVHTLLDGLSHIDPSGYAATCLALADFDVRPRLSEVTSPILAIAGVEDIVTTPAQLASLSQLVQSGRYAEVPDAAHLAPLEQPSAVATLIAPPHRKARPCPLAPTTATPPACRSGVKFSATPTSTPRTHTPPTSPATSKP